MNSCILMAELVSDPQLRYTADAQIPIAEMEIQFPNLGNDSRPVILKAIAWGGLSEEVKQKYRAGDRIIVEGRLTMNVIERREGFKEKRAELTVSKIYPLEFEGVSGGVNTVSSRDYNTAVSQPEEEDNFQSNVVSLESRRSAGDTQSRRGGGDRFTDEQDDFYPPPPSTPSVSEGDVEADEYDDPIPF